MNDNGNGNELKAEYLEEEVEDARTGEMIPRSTKGDIPELRPGILAQININQVGTLDVSDEALAVLEEPLDPEDVRIRADGLVYLPWTWYNKRLNRAFGVFKWGLIPQGAPMVKNMGSSVLVVWLNWLVIKGVPVSVAGGEMSYQPNNNTMSYGDAVEGARSNSLARNCKNIGMAIELWDKDWIAAWKKQYAESYESKGRTYWRRKGQVNRPVAQEKAEKPVEKVEKAEAADQNNTKPAAANETVEKLYTVEGLSKYAVVTAIAGQAGKTKSNVVDLISTLDKKGKYTISEIVKALNPEQDKQEEKEG